MKKKNVKFKAVCLMLVVAMVFMAMPVWAVGNNERMIDNAIHPMSEAEIQAMWDEMVREAEAAVTPEQIYEIERMMEAERYFFDNLTLETLWEVYLDENPEILLWRMSADELSNIRGDLAELYEFIKSQHYTITPRSPFANAARAYSRHFSGEDGVGAVARSAIEADGALALWTSDNEFPGAHNNMIRDALRHYLWNFLAVLHSSGKPLTQAGRLNAARIYTTNYELATNILRRTPSLRTETPTATQRGTAMNLRSTLLNSSFAVWESLFNVNCNVFGHGWNDLMDLWNNEIGRTDAIIHGEFSFPLVLFNNRWNNNDLIRTYQATGVTAIRRSQIFLNRWDTPVR
jgi:hypothetical protein